MEKYKAENVLFSFVKAAKLALLLPLPVYLPTEIAPDVHSAPSCFGKCESVSYKGEDKNFF